MDTIPEAQFPMVNDLVNRAKGYLTMTDGALMEMNDDTAHDTILITREQLRYLVGTSPINGIVSDPTPLPGMHSARKH